MGISSEKKELCTAKPVSVLGACTSRLFKNLVLGVPHTDYPYGKVFWREGRKEGVKDRYFCPFSSGM